MSSTNTNTNTNANIISIALDDARKGGVPERFLPTPKQVEEYFDHLKYVWGGDADGIPSECDAVRALEKSVCKRARIYYGFQWFSEVGTTYGDKYVAYGSLHCFWSSKARDEWVSEEYYREAVTRDCRPLRWTRADFEEARLRFIEDSVLGDD